MLFVYRHLTGYQRRAAPECAGRTAAHALGYDDQVSTGHPSAVLFSAILAESEHLGCNAKRLQPLLSRDTRYGPNSCAAIPAIKSKAGTQHPYLAQWLLPALLRSYVNCPLTEPRPRLQSRHALQRIGSQFWDND